MDTTNFEVFNRIALHVLIRLFEAFPERLDLDAHRIGIDAKPEDPNETNEEIWESMTLGYYTISWLQEEGFITVQSTTMDSQFHGVRLTLAGLTLLGYQAPSLEEGEAYGSFAEKGAEVLQEGGRAAAVEFVKDLFLRGATAGVQLFT